LRLAPERAAGIAAVNAAVTGAQLFAAVWANSVDASLRAGDTFGPTAAALRDRLDTLEDVVRANGAFGGLPATLQRAARGLVLASASAADAWDALRREVVAAEIRRRLSADPQLQAVDGHQLSAAFDRYRELEAAKRQLVCDVIVDRWLNDQRDRLLVDTGTRLNAAGAELKRRLLLRGERAMRLRQVVARGREIPGGDPLFDLCPVWMVSPETVAQVFPREPIFDAVVFDEASQCRLEEALPVLTRGKRVVIAGDPKQLPPTRFFESGFAASEDADEPTTDQEWFEQQQGDVEDLLTAALGLDAQQSYLDVHYRSKHAALIGFSNTHFYGDRLQPIPGHPSRRPALPPIRLVPVAGVYDKRRNEPEADAVVALVKELLGERKPPSIGIACFNLAQRDLIVEKLDDLAADDARFAKRLTEARERVGEGAFQGLFVKNLENVQGDERDHLIVSTTYGPDPAGRFYRRFGPLAMPGGGRRLNVLVTRARQQVHLVTSIPQSAYRSLPDPADGQSPGGGWLLFAYLRYADELTREYGAGVSGASTLEGSGGNGAKPQAPAGSAGDGGAGDAPAVTRGAAQRAKESAAGSGAPEPDVDASADVDADGSAVPGADAGVRVRPTRAPSLFAESLAHRLAAGGAAAADVYWGNDGFCVDLAVRDAGGGDPVGVLCDAARFAPADDLMAWDVFRTGVLEAQGWRLHRVWTPHFFRDPAGQTAAIRRGRAEERK
ncbi:MAG: helicase, partial [Phycisphaerales bacterium]|nr:helicase [Phycisphaerales bacterium]